jgi:hypothetical protein
MLLFYAVHMLGKKDRLQKLAEDDALMAYTILHSSIESFKDVLICSINKEYRYLKINKAFE